MTKHKKTILKRILSSVTAFSLTFLLLLCNVTASNAEKDFEKYLAERNAAYESLLKESNLNVQIRDGVILSAYGTSNGKGSLPLEIRGSRAEFISDSFSLQGGITQLEIPDGIYAILSSDKGVLSGSGAFYGNTSLKRVIPKRSLKYIGNKAFYGAKNLEYFFFPYLTRHIGDYAFAYCENLNTASIYGDTSIGSGAFTGCTSLTEVYLSTRVTRVGLDAFLHTPFYESLTDEFGLCGDILLRYNGNGGDVVIPDGVRIIADGVFAGRASLNSVTFPESIRYIGNSAFRSCVNLKEIHFKSENVEDTKNITLGENAFDMCNLEEQSLSVLKSLPTDKRSITITEKNINILKKSPVSAIELIRSHSTLLAETLELPDKTNTENQSISSYKKQNWCLTDKFQDITDTDNEDLYGILVYKS